MAKKKNQNGGVLRRARGIYADALCNCGDRRSVVDCTVPRTDRKNYNVGPSKDIDGEDLRGLMQLLSMRKGGGAVVDVDSEGNIVWRKPAAAAAEESSYGRGVGRIGRIDEDKLCCFNEGEVLNKFRYSRTLSKNNSDAINVSKQAY